MEEVKTENTKPESNQKPHDIAEITEEVIKVLKTCYDPEIPVNVFDLGLIYDIKIATNGDVLVVMTLTSPACPVAGILPPEIQERLKEHPMIHDARVEITFDPPWSVDKMTEEAKLELGFL
jgi:FeS assembly SUF system protein